MAIVQPIGVGTIDRIEGGGGTMVVLVAMIILFGAAMYFTGRYGGEEGQARQAGMVTIIVVLVLIAFMLGGLNLG